MGVLETVLGGSTPESDTTDDEQKYAVLLNAGPGSTPTAANGFNYLLELDDAGYEARLFLDGKATKWPAEFHENPDRPFNHEWEQIRARGLLTGACGFCANAFDVAAACERSDVALLSDTDEHAPEVAHLVEEGYELLTIG
jgi:hypothetical protein